MANDMSSELPAQRDALPGADRQTNQVRRTFSRQRLLSLAACVTIAVALPACNESPLSAEETIKASTDVSAHAIRRRPWRRWLMPQLPKPPQDTAAAPTPPVDTTKPPAPPVTPPAPPVTPPAPPVTPPAPPVTPPAPPVTPPAPPITPPAPPVTPPVPPNATGTWTRIDPPINLGLHGRDQFGFGGLALSASSPNIVYVGTCYEGIWKTTNSGTSWFRVSTGQNGPNLATGRNWTLAVDPTNANVVYTVAGYGSGQGLWKSTNGGVDWTQMLSPSVMSATTASIYNVAIDPADHNHLLLGSHHGWGGSENAGVLESRDAGANWTLHRPQGTWGKGHYVFFINSTTWLLGTQEYGYWRTTNGGTSWTQVVGSGTANMPHGAGSLYKASTGVLYIGASNSLLRSTDNGASWSRTGPTSTDGFMSVVGDGTYMYTQRANTGMAISGPSPYYISRESDGLTWTAQNNGAQTFPNGPGHMAFDATNRIIYSSNWLAGVWKLQLGTP